MYVHGYNLVPTGQMTQAYNYVRQIQVKAGSSSMAGTVLAVPVFNSLNKKPGK